MFHMYLVKEARVHAKEDLKKVLYTQEWLLRKVWWVFD